MYCFTHICWIFVFDTSPVLVCSPVSISHTLIHSIAILVAGSLIHLLSFQSIICFILFSYLHLIHSISISIPAVLFTFSIFIEIYAVVITIFVYSLLTLILCFSIIDRFCIYFTKFGSTFTIPIRTVLLKMMCSLTIVLYQYFDCFYYSR